MAFRKVQKFVPTNSHIVYELEEKVNKNGIFIKEYARQDKQLPDPDMFDLKNILDAGVELEEVNSKIMNSNTVNADTVVRKYTKKTEEVKNEK